MCAVVILTGVYAHWAVWLYSDPSPLATHINITLLGAHAYPTITVGLKTNDTFFYRKNDIQRGLPRFNEINFYPNLIHIKIFPIFPFPKV